jgi:hypothetical protein
MRRIMTTVVAAGLAVSACGTAPVETTPAPTPAQPAPPPADASYIPANTHLQVTLDQELNTTNSRVGDSFTVSLTEPLLAANGHTVIPAGARIQGMVTGVAQPGGSDPAVLRLNFLRVNVDNAWHPLTADIATTHIPMEGGHRDHAQTAQAAVAGAAAGAAIGAVISGRLRDSLIGAAIGAGAGTIISLGMGGATEAVLPEGTHMTLRTVDRVQVRSR